MVVTAKQDGRLCEWIYLAYDLKADIESLWIFIFHCSAISNCEVSKWSMYSYWRNKGKLSFRKFYQIFVSYELRLLVLSTPSVTLSVKGLGLCQATSRPGSSRVRLWEWFGSVLAWPIVGQNRVGPKWAQAKIFWLVSPWANDGLIFKNLKLYLSLTFHLKCAFFIMYIFFPFWSNIFDVFFKNNWFLLFSNPAQL